MSRPERDRRAARRWLTLCGLLLVGVSVSYATPARAADVVTLLDATATLPAQAEATVTFPLTAANGMDLAKVEAKVLRIRRGEVQMGVPNEFGAAVDDANAVLELTVPVDVLAVQGVYSVVVLITHETTRQLATVTLTRAAALVSFPSTIQLERDLNADDRPKLTIVASPDSRVLSLTPRQIEAEGPTVDVTVPTGFKLEPGESASLAYEVTGKATPGTVTRTVQLTSPQLAQPVQVTFTIVTKRSAGLIAVGLLVGVALGLLLRIILPRIAAWRVAQARRNELLEQLDRWRSDYTDPVFVGELITLINTLKATSTSGLTKANDETTTKATNLLEALKTKLTGLAERHRTAVTGLDGDWRLPADSVLPGRENPQPGFRAGVDMTRRLLKEAEAAIRSHDATAATSLLDGVDQTAGELDRDGRSWIARVGVAISDLETAAAGRTRGALGILALAAQTIRSALQDMPADDAGTPVTRAKTTLQRIHEVTTAYAVVSSHLDELANEAEDAAAALGPNGTQALRDSAQALRRVDRGDDPADFGTAVGRAVKRVVDEANAALGVDAASQAVKDAFAQGALVEAAHQVLNDRQGAALGGVVDPAIRAAEAVLPRIPVITPANQVEQRFEITATLRDLPSSGLLASVRGGELLLHALVAIAVVLLTGYALFLPTWTGAFADIMQVVAWGFAVDVSVAGLTALMQAQPKPATK